MLKKIGAVAFFRTQNFVSIARRAEYSEECVSTWQELEPSYRETLPQQFGSLLSSLFENDKMGQNDIRVSYTDIDIYGRGFDGVFGPGAEKIGRRNAVLALKAKQDFKACNASNDYIEYDLYGRADPRIFGFNAHKINAESTAEHSKQRRSLRKGKKSLRAILSPFGKRGRLSRFLKRKSSKQVQSNTEDRSIETSNRSIVNTQLEPIEDNPLGVGNELPSEESPPPVTAGTVASVAKIFNSEKKAEKVERSLAAETGLSKADEVYVPQRSHEFQDVEDLDVASIAEVSSPEVSDVGTWSKSSKSEVEEPETDSTAVEKGWQSSASHVNAEDKSPVDSVQTHSTSRLMQDQPSSNEASNNNSIQAGDSFGVQEYMASKAVSQTGANSDFGSTSRAIHSPDIVSPRASSGSASSSSSLGIEAVAVTEVGGSDSHSRSTDDPVQSERDASSGESGSFTMQNSTGSSLLENQLIDASPRNQKARVPDLCQRGSSEPSLDSGTAMPNSSGSVNSNKNETSNGTLANRGVRPNGDGMEIDDEGSITELVVLNQMDPAERDGMGIQRKGSGLEQAAVNRTGSTNDREAARNTSFTYYTEAEHAARNTKLREDDEYITVEAVVGEYDCDDSDDEAFVDALDSAEDSDQSMAAASSSEIVSSSMYSTTEDSDELESSEGSSREYSQSKRGSSAGMSKQGSGFHLSASTGNSHDKPVSPGGSFTARSQGPSSSHHASSSGSGPNLVSPSDSSGLASNHSSDETESSFYSEVFESTVGDEDDNSDVFLMALSTPHEEPQL